MSDIPDSDLDLSVLNIQNHDDQNTSPATAVPTIAGQPQPLNQSVSTTPPSAQDSGGEIIQIVPHPTTNRYPWTPVENPRVPALGRTIASPIVVAPSAEPVPPPAPVSLAVGPPVIVPAPVEPPNPIAPPVQPQPVVAPTPTPPILHQPVAAPLPAVVPTPSALAPKIEEQSVVEAPPAAGYVLPQLLEVETAADTEKPVIGQSASRMPLQAVTAKSGKETGERAPTIYSDSSRQAWRTFRPNNFLRWAAIMLLLAAVGGGVYFWLANGSPTDISQLPFFQQ